MKHTDTTTHEKIKKAGSALLATAVISVTSGCASMQKSMHESKEVKEIVAANADATVLDIKEIKLAANQGTFFVYIDVDGNLTDAEMMGTILKKRRPGLSLFFGLITIPFAGEPEQITDKVVIGAKTNTAFLREELMLSAVQKDSRINANPADTATVVSHTYDMKKGVTLQFEIKNPDGTVTYMQGIVPLAAKGDVLPGATMPPEVVKELYKDVKTIPAPTNNN